MRAPYHKVTGDYSETLRARPAILQERPDFSLVLGGPVYQLFRRIGLAAGERDVIRLLVGRMLVFAIVAWLPLLLLSVFAGQAKGTSGIRQRRHPAARRPSQQLQGGAGHAFRAVYLEGRDAARHCHGRTAGAVALTIFSPEELALRLVKILF